MPSLTDVSSASAMYASHARGFWRSSSSSAATWWAKRCRLRASVASRTVSMSDAPVALLRSSKRECVSVSTRMVVVAIPLVYIMHASRSTPRRSITPERLSASPRVLGILADALAPKSTGHRRPSRAHWRFGSERSARYCARRRVIWAPCAAAMCWVCVSEVCEERPGIERMDLLVFGRRLTALNTRRNVLLSRRPADPARGVRQRRRSGSRVTLPDTDLGMPGHGNAWKGQVRQAIEQFVHSCSRSGSRKADP